MQKLLNSPDSYKTFKTQLEECSLKMSSDSTLICRSSGVQSAKIRVRCDYNWPYLDLKALGTLQDFFKQLLDFNHTKITLWTLCGPNLSDFPLKSASNATKNHQYGSFHAITPNLYSVLASKLQLTLIISRSSFWTLA